MIKKLYIAGVIAAAVMGVATSVSAGPECDHMPAGGDCDAQLNEALFDCQTADPGDQATCRLAARAVYSACMNENACT